MARSIGNLRKTPLLKFSQRLKPATSFPVLSPEQFITTKKIIVMKKLFVLAAMVTLLAVSASAQVSGDRMRRHRTERGFNGGRLTRPEKFRLQKNDARYRVEKRRASRDGRIDRFERRKLNKMRRHDRRETFRLRHNGRRRLI
jgi:hypothetical protein